MPAVSLKNMDVSALLELARRSKEHSLNARATCKGKLHCWAKDEGSPADRPAE